MSLNWNRSDKHKYRKSPVWSQSSFYEEMRTALKSDTNFFLHIICCHENQELSVIVCRKTTRYIAIPTETLNFTGRPICLFIFLVNTFRRSMKGQNSMPAQLENVAINDVLLLKAARRDAIANLQCFWGPRTPAAQFRWLYLHSVCGATLFGSHQLRLPPSVWQSLVGLRSLSSVCDAWQQSRTQILRKLDKTSGPTLAVCGPKSTKFWDFVVNCLCFSAYFCPIIYGAFRSEDNRH